MTWVPEKAVVGSVPPLGAPISHWFAANPVHPVRAPSKLSVNLVAPLLPETWKLSTDHPPLVVAPSEVKFILTWRLVHPIAQYETSNEVAIQLDWSSVFSMEPELSMANTTSAGELAIAVVFI